MKYLLTLCLVLATTVSGYCLDFNNVTFKPFANASTAISSTPNLRIGLVTGKFASDGNTVIQGFPLPNIENFYLTKEIVYNLSNKHYPTSILIEVDQDTKMFTGDTTNYLKILAGERLVYTIK